MVIGETDSLAEGDSVNVYTTSGQWVKRLDASEWSSDRGRVLWDGIDYRGLSQAPGAYEWSRNGGQHHEGTLIEDFEEPILSDLRIDSGSGSVMDDTLSFRFLDEDTHGGRVRATVTPTHGSSYRVFKDELFGETPTGAPPIERSFSMASSSGRSVVRVLVWDVGGGQFASDTLGFWPISGVTDQHVYVPDVKLLRGRPNPSTQWVAWDLQRSTGGIVNLNIVGVDGRRVKSWSDKEISSGTTRVLWNGRDDRGAQVPSGRYFLVATDGAGRIVSKSATVVVR